MNCPHCKSEMYFDNDADSQFAEHVSHCYANPKRESLKTWSACEVKIAFGGLELTCGSDVEELVGP